MLRLTAAAGIALAYAVAPNFLQAQTCLGHRPLTESSTNISLNVRMMEKASGGEMRVNTGKPRAFGGFGLGLTNVGGGNRAFDIGVMAGSAVVDRMKFSICPVVSFNHQPAVNAVSTYPRTQEIGGGLGIGSQQFLTDRFALYPYAGIGILRTRIRTSARDFPPEIGIPSTNEEVLSNDGADIWAGVALEVSRRVLFRTALRHRAGLGSRSNVVSIGVTLAPDRK